MCERVAGVSLEACLTPPRPHPVLRSLRACRQWTEPPLPLGQMKRERWCRAGPTAAGGQGAGACGASAGHPPGLLAPLTQVCLWWVGGLAEEGPEQCPQCLLLHCPSVHPERPPSLTSPAAPTPRAQFGG